jgi:hypothetical protein
MKLLLRCIVIFVMNCLLIQAATQLKHQGKTLFASEANVSYGAVHDAHAVKAVIDSPDATAIRLFTGKKPQRVFLNNELLPEQAWSFEQADGCIALTLPEGRQSLQARFDGLDSLKPIELTLPVEANGKMLDDTAQAKWTDGLLYGEFTWNEARSGLFTAILTSEDGQALPAQLFVRGGARSMLMEDDSKALLLQSGAILAFTLPVPDGKVPNLQLKINTLPGMPSLLARDRVKTLAQPGAIIIEGEDFSAERGGTVSISSEHQNTSNGGCIFSWANAGHAIDWQVNMAEAGSYAMTIVIATTEAVATRYISLNGQPIPGLKLLQFYSTGGWGRSNAKDWQALQPQDDQGRPLPLNMNKGSNTITITNSHGQHLNIDCIVLEKIKP